MSFFGKFFNRGKKEDLEKGLEKTKTSFLGKLTKAVAGKSKVDEEVLDELENILITSGSQFILDLMNVKISK